MGTQPLRTSSLVFGALAGGSLALMALGFSLGLDSGHPPPGVMVAGIGALAAIAVAPIGLVVSTIGLIRKPTLPRSQRSIVHPVTLAISLAAILVSVWLLAD